MSVKKNHSCDKTMVMISLYNEIYEGRSKSFEPNLFRQGMDKRAHIYFLTYSLPLLMPSW